jgi:GTP cyclohydrolase II
LTSQLIRQVEYQHFGVDRLRQRDRRLAADLQRVAERVPLLVNRNAFNNSYLNTKQAKLGHLMTPLAEAVAEDGEL